MKPDASNITRINAPGKGGRRTRIKFGSVTVSVEKPSLAEIKRNVDISTFALERIKEALVHPGVRLKSKKDIPLFSVDPNHPDTFIRELNGKSERGILENGEFKVIG